MLLFWFCQLLQNHRAILAMMGRASSQWIQISIFESFRHSKCYSHFWCANLHLARLQLTWLTLKQIAGLCGLSESQEFVVGFGQAAANVADLRSAGLCGLSRSQGCFKGFRPAA